MGEHALNAAPPSAAPRLAPQIATSAADGRSVSAAASGRIMLNEPAVNDLGEYVNAKYINGQRPYRRQRETQ